MGLFDKVKSAAETAKNAAATAKSSYDAAKAEREAVKAEMKAKADEKLQEILDTINAFDNDGFVFENTGTQELLDFTKNFYEKLLLPACSVSLTKISMYPYIEGKPFEKVKSRLNQYEEGDTPLVMIKGENKQIILITKNNLYFSILQEDDRENYLSGKISCEQIDKFIFTINEEKAEFSCDGYTFAVFKADKTIKEDFITLTNYFDCIEKHDFEITDEEVDALIKEKIGEKVANEIKKYMMFDDEKLVYFAWGINSLTAKDYIVCTNKQIIITDREAFGLTANVRQIYYEDITSANTEQNSTSSDLTGMLIDTAITAATKTCDLIITVAGSKIKIDTLYKLEAERVVAIYHQFRKELKTAAAQPQVIVQQAAADPMEQLKKLKELLDMGVVSQEEFDAKKKELLGL